MGLEVLMELLKSVKAETVETAETEETEEMVVREQTGFHKIFVLQLEML